MICKKCASEIAEDSIFCNYCGSKVDRELLCSKCGIILPSGSKFCNICGTFIGNSSDCQDFSNDSSENSNLESNKIDNVNACDFDYEQYEYECEFDKYNTEFNSFEFDFDETENFNYKLDTAKKVLYISGTGKLTSHSDKFYEMSKALNNKYIQINELTFEGFDSIAGKLDPCFFDYPFMKNVKTLSLLNGITSIEDYAFALMPKLTTVNLSNDLQYIGQEAFFNCFVLKNITIPTNVKSIFCDAFSKCSSLKDITIPDNIEYVHKNAFEECTHVTYLGQNEDVLENAPWGAYTYN